MQGLKTIIRLFGYLLLLSILCMLIGFAIGGPRGAWLGASLPLLGSLGVLFGSEAILSKIYRAHRQIPDGLSQSLRQVLSSSPVRRTPRLLVYCAPSPNILIARSLWGRGTFLISQGLISTYKEEDLRQILESCVEQISHSEAIFQSFCSVIVLSFLMMAPKSWVRFVYSNRRLSLREEELLKPFSTVLFLMVFPYVQGFLFKQKLRPEKAASPNSLTQPSAAVRNVKPIQGYWDRPTSGNAFHFKTYLLVYLERQM